jgi:hypothetical protein
MKVPRKRSHKGKSVAYGLVSSFAFLCYSIIHYANERHNVEAAMGDSQGDDS